MHSVSTVPPPWGKNNGRTEYTPYAYSSTYLASTAHFSHRSISSSSVAISSPSSSKLSSSSSCSHAVMRSEKFYTTHHNKMFKFILLNLFLYFFDAGKVKSKVQQDLVVRLQEVQYPRSHDYTDIQ